MSFEKKIRNMIKARSGNLWVNTAEEYRAERKIMAVASKLGHKVFCWRCSVGMFPVENPDEADKAMSNPLKLAETLFNYTNGPMTIIVEDVSSYLSNPQIARFFKDIGRKSQSSSAQEWVQVIALDSADVQPNFTLVELDLPARPEIEKLVDGMLRMVPERVRDDLSQNGNRDAAIDALTGLEAAQAQQAMAQSLAEVKKIDPEILIQSKKALISGSGAIEWKDPDPRGLDAVGGLRRLKTYLQRRRKAFQKSRAEDMDRRLPRPKGIMVAGIPGTGKSLSAKAVAAAWQLPLLRFDVGAAFGKFVGESEKGLKKALKVAEAVAPCILWIDEVEKGLAGSGGGGESDGGTTVRVFGEFLTWMNETEAPVYIVATCNNPTNLPSEFFRPGRFDRIWFVDSPNRTDRVEVLNIMVDYYGLSDVGLDLEKVADATSKFTGAELEHAIVEALWAADDEERDPTTADVLKAAEDVNPIVVGWGDRGTLAEVRDWATAAAVPANDPEEKGSKDGEFAGRVYNLMDEDSEDKGEGGGEGDDNTNAEGSN